VIPVAPAWFREEVLAKCATDAWQSYPELGLDLRERVGAHYGVGPGNVVVTRGCREAIRLALGRFTGRPLAVPSPSWPGFVQLAEQAGTAWSYYPVGDGPPDTGVPIVCTLNNPTGDVLAPEVLAELVERPAIVDCTYDDFADTPLLPQVHRFLGGRAVFCVNLGKAPGLTGARLGLALAREDIARDLEAAADPDRLDLFQLAVLDTLFTERGVHAWRAAAEQARAAGARCADLLTASLPCARVTTSIGYLVYGEYDQPCHHLDAVVAAAGAEVFPIERKFRVLADAALAALPVGAAR
jgi:histidinol-phosphate/aromatic aminotransferase/cobyric acid decarboxylase-like protein